MARNGHDWATAVYRDKELIGVNAGKGDRHPYKNPDMPSPSLVVWYENPYLKTFRQLLAGQANAFSRNNITKYLKQMGVESPWTYVGHHESHAAHYFQSGFDEATVVVIDSIGEFDCSSIWSAKGNKLTKLWSSKYPKSLGLFYSAMTQRAGMLPQLDEGKLEALASNPRLSVVSEIEQLLHVNLHKGIGDFGEWSPREIASATQHIFLAEVSKIISKAYTLNISENVVVAGGCAFNKGLRIEFENVYNNVYIPANPSDSGSAVTAVLAYEARKK